MKKSIITGAVALFATALLFSACKKDKNDPHPHEEELITTIQLSLNDGSHTHVYSYKVENGFGNPTSGSVQVDTLHLSPGAVYEAAVTVLNETEDQDHTMEEILEEQDRHLFLYISTPATGNGAVVFSDGSLDDDGKPFNHTGKLTAGGAGNGQLEVYLIHAPTDKNGATPAASGGGTDAHAIFPVMIH